MSSAQRPILNERYELEQRIGRGGMADVFLARDLLLDRPVAIKVLFPEYAADPAFVERFRREAQSAANLNHPNIVGVYDWGRYGSTYFITMEYVAGRTLAEVLRTNGPITPEQANDVAIEVASALSFAHRNGVVHRDIKPANVLVSHDGRVKVADFGIARALNSADEQELTQAGSVMGTATYFSPEQAQGAQPDPRSDLYSLGVVMYELVSGRPPFTGESPIAVAYKQVHDTAAPLHTLVRDIPDDFEAIVDRLLDKDPAGRYDTAELLREDLRRFKDGAPVAANGGTAPAAAPTPVSLGGNAAAPQRGPAAPSPEPRQPAYPPTAVAPPIPPTMPQGFTVGPPPDYPAQRPRSPVGVIIVAMFILVLLAAGGVVLYNVLSNREPGGGPVGRVAVPEVVGLKLQDAQKKLLEANLLPDIRAVEKEGVEDDVVYDQSPAPDQEVDEGSKVIITYNPAPGTQLIEMPDLINLKFADAQKLLKRLGFDITRLTEQKKETSDAEEGTVLDQAPTKGQQVPNNSDLIVVTATHPSKVKIPENVGSDPAAVAALLEDLGLKTTQVSEVNSAAPAGTIIRLEPSAGNTVKWGSTVRIVVSSGPADATVPNLVGLTELQASQALTAEGLKIKIGDPIEVPAGNPQVGKVMSQTPLAGSTQPQGTTITVRLGKAFTPATTTTSTTTTTTTTTLPPDPN